MLLRRITQHLKDQNWFAVFVDFVIVVVGILIAFQITEWNEERAQQGLETSYLNRLAVDLRSTVDYLNLKSGQADEIKKVIEKSLLVLNADDSGDKELIEAVSNYISKGSNILDFKVTRTTFDDLKSSGNLHVLRNKELVRSLGQLHTNFTEHNLSALVNTDWILPFESRITAEFDFLRFDARTMHLFPNDASSNIATHIRSNHDLLRRHAALHYWYTDVIRGDYQQAILEAQAVLGEIILELNK